MNYKRAKLNTEKLVKHQNSMKSCIENKCKMHFLRTKSALKKKNKNAVDKTIFNT